MAETPATLHDKQTTPKRGRSEIKFPVYGLADCVAVAKAVHEKGGGVATNDHLAAFLGYRSANNGAFISKIAAAKMFGLIVGPPQHLTITPRAQTILMPIRDTDVRAGLVEAFFAVPLYKAIYEEYHGKELPPEFGMKNAMRTHFGITPQRIDRAFRAFMASADVAGFFDVRGSRTQLIIPSIPAATPRPTQDEGADGEGETSLGGGGGDKGNGGGGDGPRDAGKSLDALRTEYVSTLIALLKDKGANGEVDADLMERIEKLLELRSGN